MGAFDSFDFGKRGKSEVTEIKEEISRRQSQGEKIENLDVVRPANRVSIDLQEGFVAENNDGLHRRLGNRQIQLIAVGGAIGTALFVSIGSGLNHAGPGSLFLSYTLYCCIIGMTNNCIAEMTTAFPVSGGFIRLAGHFVDDAWGFMAGWNFFLYEALSIPFEITATCTVLGFWVDDLPDAAVITTMIVLYALLNIMAVRFYGEAEFWLSGGKLILIFLLYSFTFVTMCGGNPRGDAYGFRNWTKPGAFAPYLHTGSLGRFEGFLAGLWSASFVVVGPEYISMVAAEAKRPRIYIKQAFKTVYWRFGAFFILGALCVGVLIPYNDPQLVKFLGSGTAAASPYVIAMQNLGVSGLPNLVNALLITSIFSAGNTYTYCATRNLYGLALEGRAPRILTYCTRQGVPIYAFCVVMIFPCLSFLQLGNNTSTVLGWFTNLITAGGVINYISILLTYVFYYRATQAQGLDRMALPYKGKFQPYCGYIALCFEVMVVFCYGYSSFIPWSVTNFFIYYALLILAPVTFGGWKLLKGTKFIKPHEADLVWERPIIDVYESTFVDAPVGFWVEMAQLFGLYKRKGGNDQRIGSISA